MHPNSQPWLGLPCGCRESNPGFSVPEKTQHPWQLAGGCPTSGGCSDSLAGFLQGRSSHILQREAGWVGPSLLFLAKCLALASFSVSAL